MAFVAPHQLWDAEPAQRAGGWQVGIERVGVDPHVIDVVGAGGGKAGLLRHARAHVGISAAVPVHLAFARGDAPGFVDASLDTERAGVSRDGVELLLHGKRDLHRPSHDHGERGRKRFHLYIELRAEAAAEIRDFDAHAVLGPAEQPRDLGTYE